MITILLADDHRLLREALRLLLESEPDFQVIAETGDGIEAARLTEIHKPDVLIVDMVMPSLLGLEVARQTRQASPSTRVIVLSMYDSEGYVAEALQAGASGYVLKRNSSQELIYAIRQSLAGHHYLSPPLNERSIRAYLQRADDLHANDAFEALTGREREVFQLAAQGLRNPQIAERLSLSVRTVEMHRAHLMKKLGLKSQTELVKYAMKHRRMVE
jgi:DNA-binding NarL/FixJ family response regulator